MRKYYALGLVLVLFCAVGLIAYGMYLNRTGESKIAERMENTAIPLQGEKAKFRSIQPTFVLETINFYSDEMADAVALIDGRLTEMFVTKNSKVYKGQDLFTLQNEDIPLKIQQAESGIARAEAQLANAKSSFARYTRLMEKDATSKEKYEEAQMQFLAAEAALKEAITIRDQYLVQESRQQITAPIDGEVLILYKQIGAYVTAGTPLALIGNFQRLYFSMPIEDKFAQHIFLNESFELNFRNSGALRKAYDTEFAAGNKGEAQNFPVIVREITPSLNEPATMRKVVWEVDNRVGLLEPQTYSGVTMRVSNPHRALTVPLAAVAGQDRSAVFVVTPENTLERRAVKVGTDDGSYIEIISGLREGETVITSATTGLESGVKVEVTLTDGSN
ncbi:MAG: efflux RND transporter periplasmic adaptor subunit [Selenomonadaceae bacterium]|nr:efflux RND transporter periplasmic adaptor subunit [Selenomonadaceae bacterium]